MATWRWLLLLTLCAAPPSAPADEFRPAYLQLTQLSADTYDVLWKVPALDETTTLSVHSQFPDGTRRLTPVQFSYAASTTVQRWRVKITLRLTSKAIGFS